MRIKAGIVFAGLMGTAWIAGAQTSPYSSMAMPGTHNGWTPAGSMALVADNTWVGTQTFASADGEFKFAANNGWAVNWGGGASIARVPADASAPDASGGNLSFSGLTPGDYRVTFNDSTLAFQLEWVGAPLPAPGFATLHLVGDFNGWTPGPASALTNHAGNTNLWSGSVSLETATAFQFQPDTNPTNQWGAPDAVTLTPPVTDGNACGISDFTLTGFQPGTFFVTLNTTNAAFTISQTATQTVSDMTVQGSFIATNNPPPNMMPVAGTTLWESDHHITNTTPVTVRFAGNQGVYTWGATNGTPAYALPASGALIGGETNFATVNVNAPGRYRLTFDHITGDFSFRRLYIDTSMGTNINLFKNPGFEYTTEPDGGDASNWFGYQSWPKRVLDGFAPHSGTWCGAVHAKWFPDWTDYASFSQDVLVTSGITYRASAWFKATPDWTADAVQITIEWRDGSGNPVGGNGTYDIAALTTNWVRYSVESTAPSNAAMAHVVFGCSGAGTTGTMHIDDAEFRVAAGRTQNFDTWGALTTFSSFSPDWSVTSGKVAWNIPPGRPPAGVFISQYVEGTGNNKAIEIYNGSLSNLDFAADQYILRQYDNGSLSPSATLYLTNTVAAGQTLVVSRPFASGPYTNYPPDPAITGQANLQTNKDLTFNGDDVIVLKVGGPFGPVLDRVGQVGTNATGSIWSRNTTDHTLTRKSTVWTGTLTTVTEDFPLLDEWDITEQDDFNGLGSHDISFVDPNEPYTPGGYSLIMNTGATLMSGEMPGGIGDVSFWWRTESMSPPLTVSIATAPAETGPWTTNDLLENVASSNFAYYVLAVNRADHLWLKIEQTDAGTNRFRIDEITVTEASAVPRLQDFTAWTDPAYLTPGTYSKSGWSLQSASISPTGGVSDSRCALISPPDAAILSPGFEGGVGEVRFWAKAAESGLSGRLLLQTTIDGGSNWTTRGTYTVSTAETHSVWLYITNVSAQARLVFDPSFDSDDLLVDNFEVRLPALYRSQNFDGWPTKNQYTSGTDSHQGWSVDNCIVDSDNAYQGQVARLGTSTGNFILSPELPTGIGTISFRTRKWNSGDSAFTLQLQVSENGVGWTTLDSFSAASTNYEQVTYYIYDTTNRFVRFYHSAGAVRVLIDDIRIVAPTPRPEVLVTPGLAPEPPPIEEPMQLTADVLTRYGASILSVTGSYRVGEFGPWIPLEMTPQEDGSYASGLDIPGLASGTMIRYYTDTRYAGIGAAPGSTGYTTNSTTSAVFTNYIPTVGQGHVWINEVFYSPYGLEWFGGYNHEFIELCGRAGTDISGWTIQLVFGRDQDIAANGGNPVYASYTIPASTVFTNAFTNLASGFSFYVLGDQELLDGGDPVDQVLTTTVPTNVVPDADFLKDHIHDNLGVIRLLNQFGHPVYALSYGGYAPEADRIPQTQLPFGETNSIGLIGTNYTYSGFDWEMGDLTVGELNNGQELEDPPPDSNTYAYAWHEQSVEVTPANTNLVPPFFMLDPAGAGSFDTISLYYGYTNADYPNAAGTLHHRAQGGGGWSTAAMDIREGAVDPEGHGYVVGEIPDHTYERLDTLEYILEVDPNETGVSTVYLASDAGDENLSTIYTNFAGAEAHPFTYLIPIADQIFFTNMYTNATSWIFQTDGNDPVEPIVTFSVRTTTNLLIPTGDWNTTNFTRTTNIYGQDTFTVPKDTTGETKLFYRLDLHWP